MNHQSLDPRVTRLELPENPSEAYMPAADGDQWQTYEVFHQTSRGEQHKHVGIVHAPNAEMAILFAKEQYARRSKCVNIWVVKTADVAATEYMDSDMFDPATDKSYRESFGYKNTRQLIDRYKKETHSSVADTPDDDPALLKLPKSVAKTTAAKGAIIVGKKK